MRDRGLFEITFPVLRSLFLLLALLAELPPHPTALHVSDERLYGTACVLVPVRCYLCGQLLKHLVLRCEVKKSFGNVV